MSMEEIIDQIWNMPWYKVLKIAMIDDFILLVKIWPIYVIVLILAIVWCWLAR